MPYVRGKKTFRGKRKTFRKRTVTAKSVKKIVKHAVRKNAITRRVQTLGTEVSIPVLTKLTGTNILSMFETVQGVGVSNRIGAAIKAIGMNSRFILKNNRADTVYVRMSLLRVSNPANLTSASSLFETTSGGETTITNSIAAMILPYQKDDIRVVYNKVIKLGAADLDSTDSRSVKVFSRLNTRLKYNAAGTTSTNMRFFWVFYSNDSSNDAVAGDVEITYVIDQWFADVGVAL